MKLYFSEQISEENCYPLSYFKQEMKDNGLSKMTVFEAKADKSNDYFYCKEYNEVGEKSEGGCGKVCDKYKPRNGKNGRCAHSGYCYEPTDKEKIIKIKSI